MNQDKIISGGTSFAAEAINAQLEHVLVSRYFAGAAMRGNFLRFVVTETLAGRSAQIKQYTIAVKALDREADFDPHEDPIVRIQAGRIRRSLKQYYQDEGRYDPIVIQIPNGTYVPVFRHNEAAIEAEASEQPSADPAQADAPIIAILPFTNLSGDPSRDFFVDGFGEELSHELARFQDLRVIAYFSTAQLKGQKLDVVEIGLKLAADFVLSGSVYQGPDFIRVKVGLAETRLGTQVWTHNFKRDLTTKDIFEIQEEIAGWVVGAVAGTFGAISRELWKASRGKRIADLTTYEAILHFYHTQNRGTQEVYLVAREALEQAVRIDPDHALAWATLGEVYIDGYVLSFYEMKDALGDAKKCALKAIQLDPLCQYAYHVLAYLSVLGRNRDKVLQYSEQAVALNPDSAHLVGAAAFWMSLVGDYERGLALLKKSVRLNPYYPRWFHHAPMLHHLAGGEYEQALEEANKFNMEGFFWDPLDKAAVLGLLGRRQEARLALEKVIQLNPDFEKRPRHYVSCFVPLDDLLDKFIDGLEKAGLTATS